MGTADSSNAGERPPQILFVDDEPLVVRSLRRTLGARGLAWEMHFADSGTQALQIAEERLDVRCRLGGHAL